ncbi:hypothetical protein PENTCL1PPCAC_3442, partial [Pristionchus entomophagus]
TSVLQLYLDIYKIFCAVLMLINLKKFKNIPHWSWPRVITLLVLFLILCIPIDMSYTNMLKEQVNSVKSLNAGLLYDMCRSVVAWIVFVFMICIILPACGYKKGLTCDEENCPGCLIPKRKHPETWAVNALEFQFICLILYYPMAFVMACSQMWFDTTDFGYIFFGTTSLVPWPMPNGTSAISSGAPIS